MTAPSSRPSTVSDIPTDEYPWDKMTEENNYCGMKVLLRVNAKDYFNQLMEDDIYILESKVGQGCFGNVYKAVSKGLNQRVAIKQVMVDDRYKNREMSIMYKISHDNIVKLHHAFEQEQQSKEKILFVVMELMTDSLDHVLRSCNKHGNLLHLELIKLFTFQILRALGYLMRIGISHRDIKPSNLLLCRSSNRLKMCDFGSAKKLTSDEPSVPYICSRFYRAPELVFGSQYYTCRIDLWSSGCVIAELLTGEVLFLGVRTVDQLVEIIKVLGCPNQDEIQAMRGDCKQHEFPHINPLQWSSVICRDLGQDADKFYELLDGFLKYNPNERIPPTQALALPIFDVLRDENCSEKLPGNIPDIFKLSKEELELISKETYEKIVPEWYRKDVDSETLTCLGSEVLPVQPVIRSKAVAKVNKKSDEE